MIRVSVEEIQSDGDVTTWFCFRKLCRICPQPTTTTTSSLATTPAAVATQPVRLRLAGPGRGSPYENRCHRRRTATASRKLRGLRQIRAKKIWMNRGRSGPPVEVGDIAVGEALDGGEGLGVGRRRGFEGESGSRLRGCRGGGDVWSFSLDSQGRGRGMGGKGVRRLTRRRAEMFRGQGWA